MYDVRSAIHVRTGPAALTVAVDEWLTGHGVASRAFDDAYAACAHLLLDFDLVPDLALVAVDALRPDELELVGFIRQTWPRTGIIVYGELAGAGLADGWPRTMSCRSPAALRQLLAEPPTDALRRLLVGDPPTERSVLPRPVPAGGAQAPAAGVPMSGMPRAADGPAARAAGGANPDSRAVLTAEELAALLDEGDATRR